MEEAVFKKEGYGRAEGAQETTGFQSSWGTGCMLGAKDIEARMFGEYHIDAQLRDVYLTPRSV